LAQSVGYAERVGERVLGVTLAVLLWLLERVAVCVVLPVAVPLLVAAADGVGSLVGVLESDCVGVEVSLMVGVELSDRGVAVLLFDGDVVRVFDADLLVEALRVGVADESTAALAVTLLVIDELAVMLELLEIDSLEVALAGSVGVELSDCGVRVLLAVRVALTTDADTEIERVLVSDCGEGDALSE